MIKTILVPGLDGMCRPDALALALKLARQIDGTVEFLYVHPGARELARYLATLDVAVAPASAQVWESLVAADKEAAANARKAFEAFRDRAHAGTALAMREVEGDSRDRAVAQAIYSDLVVVGRPAGGDLTAGDATDILVSSGRPLLLAPQAPCGDPLSTVVIGWKETAASARAVAAAMPLLAAAQKIDVLGITEDGKDGEPALASAERLAAYLRDHGMRAQGGHVRAGERNPCDVLLESAGKLGAGLLVMGGYSHSRAREFVFGGFTRQVLRSAPLPVFLCH